MEANIISCKNCSNQFEGKFCNICGQNADTYRITWKEILHHLPHAVFHLDKGLLYSATQLATKPGHTVREYLQGKRKYHFNPFLMFLLLTGLSSYLYVYLHFETTLASVRLDKLNIESSLIAHKYFAARTLFFCILCSVGDWLFFYEKRYTLPEMMVANIFIFSEVTILQLLFVPLLLAAEYFNITVYIRVLMIAVVLVYMFIARYQFYEAKGNKFLITKIALAVLSYLVIVVIIGREVVQPFFKK